MLRPGKLVESIPNWRSDFWDPITSRRTPEGVPIKKLFVGNLSELTTDKDLIKYFSKYGKVTSCYIKRIKRNNRHNDFGFLIFDDVASGIEARKASDDKSLTLHGRILRVSAAHSWHQPDSIENLRARLKMESKILDNSPKIEESTEPDLNESPIHLLNDDCLIDIFLNLPFADRVRSERVCKRWQAVILESWRTVKSLDLSDKTWGMSKKSRVRSVDTCTLRKVLMRCGQSLTKLDFSQTEHKLSPSAFTIVGKFCPNLEIVNLTGLDLPPSGIYSLMDNCNNITELAISSLKSPCEKELSQLFSVSKKLKNFTCRDDQLSGKCLLYLPAKVIEKIYLIECTSLSSQRFDLALNNFSNLHTLHLEGCVCLTESTLKAIGETKSITNLFLAYRNPFISKNAINNLANLVNLEQLSFGGVSLATDEFLIHIANNCKKLKSLDICNSTAVTDRGIMALVTLPNLENLKINFLTVSDKAIGYLHNLKVLKCRSCRFIEDPGIIKLIQTAPNLTHLDMMMSNITNNTINTAIDVTMRRTNNIVLKILVRYTRVRISQLNGNKSPFLKIIHKLNDFNSSDNYHEPHYYHHDDDLYDLYDNDYSYED